MSKFHIERILAVLVVTALLVSSPAVLLSTVIAQDSAPQELRATTVTGTLPGGEFAKIWLGLEPNFPDADVTIQVDWDRPSALSNGVGFMLLDEVGLNLVLGGDQARDVAIAAGDDVFEGASNQMDASFNAFGLSDYTVVLFNDSDTDASFTLFATNATIVDGSGQVTDPTAPTITATTAITDTATIDDAADTATAPAAAPAESTETAASTAAPTAVEEEAPAAAATPSGVVRAATLEGVLPVDSATHYIGLEPNGRDLDLELVMSIDPQDNNEVLRRVNFFVIRENDLSLLSSDTLVSDIAIAAGNRRVGRATNERVANFRASGDGAYTILVQNTSPVEASYKLTVDQGVLIDDSGQTKTAQQSAITETTEAADEDSSTATTATAAPATTAKRAAAPATTAKVTKKVTSGDTYTVKAGDTISIIAREQLGSIALWRQLCAFNGLSDCNRVEIGDIIKLPTQAEIDALGDTPTSTNSSTSAATSASTAKTSTATTSTDAAADDSTDADTATSDSTEDNTAADESSSNANSDEDLANIIETIKANEDFNLLMAAIEAAGLVNALQGDKPFTIFAPTDQAFASLPEGTLDTLLADPNGQLTAVLLYHILPGALLSSGLSDGLNAQTVEGSTVKFSVSDDSISINDANIIVSDIKASNGVLHVIDAVISPPSSDATSSSDGDTSATESSDDRSSAESGSLIDQVPVLGDATNLLSDAAADGGTTVSYTTEASIADAASFYETEMERLGFTATTSVVTDQAATFTFENGDDSVRVSITPDTNSDSVLVTIQV